MPSESPLTHHKPETNQGQQYSRDAIEQGPSSFFAEEGAQLAASRRIEAETAELNKKNNGDQ